MSKSSSSKVKFLIGSNSISEDAPINSNEQNGYAFDEANIEKSSKKPNDKNIQEETNHNASDMSNSSSSSLSPEHDSAKSSYKDGYSK
jgi:hypothetical protein